MPYGRTPKGGAKNSVTSRIARGQSKPAKAKNKTTKKANKGKGFISDIQSKLGIKDVKKNKTSLKKSYDKKKKSFNKKMQKLKGMFK